MPEIIKPMLAHKWKEQKVAYPCYVQPKLNGVRALWRPDALAFQSRWGEWWEPLVLEHLCRPLADVRLLLDGELYVHGWSLQQINSAVAVKRKAPKPETLQVQFHVFDVIALRSMDDRLTLMQQINEMSPQIQFVETRLIHSRNEAEYLYRKWLAESYEGMMYRELGVHYGLAAHCTNQDNRWNRLLKRKERQDMECEIIGYNEGTGQFVGSLGSFILRTADGAHVDAGSGLTHAQRVYIWENREEFLHTQVRLEYEVLSDSGVPLKPTIACVHAYQQ